MVHRSATAIVKHGSVHALPARYPTETASTNQDVLDELHAVLLEGYTSDGQPNLPFRSLEHAAQHSPVVDKAKKALGCPSYTALWSHLLIKHPGLGMKSLNVKGDRQPEQARRAANEILGNTPVAFAPKFPAGSLHNHPLTRRVLKKNYKFFYSYKQLHGNIFCDAGKADPPKWIKQQKGIVQLGALRTALLYSLLKLRV